MRPEPTDEAHFDLDLARRAVYELRGLKRSGRSARMIRRALSYLGFEGSVWIICGTRPHAVQTLAALEAEAKRQGRRYVGGVDGLIVRAPREPRPEYVETAYRVVAFSEDRKRLTDSKRSRRPQGLRIVDHWTVERELAFLFRPRMEDR